MSKSEQLLRNRDDLDRLRLASDLTQAARKTFNPALKLYLLELARRAGSLVERPETRQLK